MGPHNGLPQLPRQHEWLAVSYHGWLMVVDESSYLQLSLVADESSPLILFGQGDIRQEVDAAELRLLRGVSCGGHVGCLPLRPFQSLLGALCLVHAKRIAMEPQLLLNLCTWTFL